jgi:hypothetical protein
MPIWEQALVCKVKDRRKIIDYFFGIFRDCIYNQSFIYLYLVLLPINKKGGLEKEQTVPFATFFITQHQKWKKGVAKNCLQHFLDQ